jgi:hypothetical protein
VVRVAQEAQGRGPEAQVAQEAQGRVVQVARDQVGDGAPLAGRRHATHEAMHPAHQSAGSIAPV